jgi:DNA-binding NtrC family response regulator
MQDLVAAGWMVQIAAELSTAHRLLKESDRRVGIIMSGPVSESECAELDGFLRVHSAAGWVGVFEPAFMATPWGRDLIVSHLFDHHTLPVDIGRLVMTLGHAYGHATLRLDAQQQPVSIARDASILGRSAAVMELQHQIRRVSKVDAAVLIRGESGSGKELTAQAIHRQSARAKAPFVPVNCGAIQASLIQSELFGHVKGAFTGATSEGRGLIESANGGTIFLDEIGDLSLELQINLLRFLQEKTINRVGSSRSIHVDARVIAATHVDLEAAVAAGTFREDLFYRLNVVPLRVPSLRERLADIELLAEAFFESFVGERAPHVKGFSRRAIAAMSAHTWPGNVRELMNRVRRAAILAQGRLIGPRDLGLEECDESRGWDMLEEARMGAEHRAIAATLQNSGKNVTEAAKQLGVSRMTLYRLMAKHGIGQNLRS